MGRVVALLDQHDILIYLFFYDDGAQIWNTGDAVEPEGSFVEAIVRRFKHHKPDLDRRRRIGGRYSTARVQTIAATIQRADDRGHLIGTIIYRAPHAKPGSRAAH